MTTKQRMPEALANDGSDVLLGSRSESALGPGPPRMVQNAQVLSFIRDDWIAKQVSRSPPSPSAMRHDSP